MTEAQENAAHHRVLATALGITVRELRRWGRLGHRPRGFDLLPPARALAIRRQGGKAAHGRHRFTSETAKAAVRAREAWHWSRPTDDVAGLESGSARGSTAAAADAVTS